MLKYIEKKTHAHDGPAWIGHVETSRSGQTFYFNNQAFRKVEGGGVLGNYVDVESGEEYWISGPQKDGGDRRDVGSGKVFVQESALTEYLALRGLTELPAEPYEVVSNIQKTEIQRFNELENSGAERLPEPAGRQTL